MFFIYFVSFFLDQSIVTWRNFSALQSGSACRKIQVNCALDAGDLCLSLRVNVEIFETRSSCDKKDNLLLTMEEPFPDEHFQTKALFIRIYRGHWSTFTLATKAKIIANQSVWFCACTTTFKSSSNVFHLKIQTVIRDRT